MERVYSLVYVAIITAGVVAGITALTLPLYYGTIDSNRKQSELSSKCVDSGGSWIVGPNGYYQCIAGRK
ncbi:hypothetical protein EVB32_286 [Rhizobium phage RHph_TM39]|uniref:Uncharacterized protein n=2 Tax=Cuauhnahuacvirus TaxID=3044696 RepID=A0A7S5UXU0_9CAUD|nr:hypothetical protein PQC16_gp352 [Rhizobium phage RHph_TM30]YP_010671437.1 hypothetical protein PQC17_gp353 [Rhizobium phage RHph_Y65]QIG71760.1 hypothetical protein EVB94_305 [Rhizobium phage RHph_TM40]QIG72121.1 hypothetical protein EVB95_303 [Rhizobium phage RHph_TM2_3B]QIG72483.1 hypothetical protein EVB96_303 [Rhizobium phage RHph_TM3_3_6]QIG77258.1 hypothetical protein EVB32_286 [Rhizobium phage RHph_TM39]QIG77551.1 hypothetical protein EVB61_241 [Rhizobium phage RHph_TM21B]QIG77873